MKKEISFTSWIYGPYIWDNWLMSSFTYIVIQEYLSRSRQKYVLFISLTRVVSFKLFLRNSWNCIAWRLNILMNTVRLEHKSFRPIFGLLLSTTVDIVSLLFSPMQSFDISTKTKLEISIVTLSLLQHWPFYFYGNEDNTHVYCPISSINIVLAAVQEIIFLSTSSIECKW